MVDAELVAIQVTEIGAVEGRRAFPPDARRAFVGGASSSAFACNASTCRHAGNASMLPLPTVAGAPSTGSVMASIGGPPALA